MFGLYSRKEVKKLATKRGDCVFRHEDLTLHHPVFSNCHGNVAGDFFFKAPKGGVLMHDRSGTDSSAKWEASYTLDLLCPTTQDAASWRKNEGLAWDSSWKKTSNVILVVTVGSILGGGGVKFQPIPIAMELIAHIHASGTFVSPTLKVEIHLLEKKSPLER